MARAAESSAANFEVFGCYSRSIHKNVAADDTRETKAGEICAFIQRKITVGSSLKVNRGAACNVYVARA